MGLKFLRPQLPTAGRREGNYSRLSIWVNIYFYRKRIRAQKRMLCKQHGRKYNLGSWTWFAWGSKRANCSKQCVVTQRRTGKIIVCSETCVSNQSAKMKTETRTFKPVYLATTRRTEKMKFDESRKQKIERQNSRQQAKHAKEYFD